MTKRVAILHPWFPQYREPFFRQLVALLAEHDVATDVYHGPPPPEWGDRGDAVVAEYAHQLPTRFVSIGSRNVAFKSVRSIRDAGPYDLLVLEQAVRNIETYGLLVRPVSSKLAFWGHGKTYTQPVSGIQERLKAKLTNRADWFFGYTAAGVDSVVSNGFPRAQTTVVANSTDTTRLVKGLEQVTAEEMADVAFRYDLKGRTAVFMGGLDSAKRLDFLVEAAMIVASRCEDFRLLVVGSGSDQAVIEGAATRCSSIKYAGPQFGREKYALLAGAQVMAMPGRVGLVAVDSLASGLPIVTTDWPWHAPEFEYLEDQVNCVVSPDGIDAYADALYDVLVDDQRLSSLSREAKRAAPLFSIEAMAQNFSKGVLEGLAL